MQSDSVLLALLSQTGVLSPEQIELLASADRSGDAGLVASVVRLGLAQEEPYLRASAQIPVMRLRQRVKAPS